MFRQIKLFLEEILLHWKTSKKPPTTAYTTHPISIRTPVITISACHPATQQTISHSSPTRVSLLLNQFRRRRARIFPYTYTYTHPRVTSPPIHNSHRGTQSSRRLLARSTYVWRHPPRSSRINRHSETIGTKQSSSFFHSSTLSVLLFFIQRRFLYSIRPNQRCKKKGIA